MTKFTKSILASAILSLALSACSGVVDKTQGQKKEAEVTKIHTVKTSTAVYSKPSASIDFQHDFAGSASVGTVETINLKMLDRYAGGTVDVSVKSSDGIELFENPKGQSLKMGGEGNDLTIQFQPKTEGVHHITVLAVARTTDGQSITRSYAIPVYVGEGFKPAKRPAPRPKDPETTVVKASGGLIIMDAEETIETPD